MLTSAPKGTKDVLPADSFKWQYVEKQFRDTCSKFGYSEIRTPSFEHTELFLRGVGQTTDIVQKEMYTFKDRADRSITLKPEGTAGVVRAYIENKLYADTQPTKLFYITPAFRYENPQAGRYRELHQVGIEMFGAKGALTDAEVISLAMGFLDKLGVNGLELNINSIGCRECRAEYNKALKDYYKDKLEDMCGDCRERYEKNPLRLIDCKVPYCSKVAKGAPVIIDYLCDDCRSHFEELKNALSAMNIKFTINPRIVRGLDYYNKTVFEIISTEIGSQGTVCGGGRYDSLIEECGGESTPGVGFGLGIERLLMVLEKQGIYCGEKVPIKIYIGSMGQSATIEAFKIAGGLRKRGVSAEFDHMGRSVKAQMRYADKLGVKYTTIIGEDELSKKVLRLKDMESGDIREITFDELIENFEV